MECQHAKRHRILDLLDSSGVIASFVCAIHCLSLPLFFALSPSFVGVLHHPYIHLMMFVFVLPIAVITLGFSVIRSKRWILLLLGLLGCSLLALGLNIEHESHGDHLHFSLNTAATWSNVLGGLCLSAAHIMNIFARKKHQTC